MCSSSIDDLWNNTDFLLIFEMKKIYVIVCVPVQSMYALPTELCLMMRITGFH